ncbi:MAG: hypothetical protein JKX69_10275 [Rhodobacteraceae bacterium]|nr:hypothetical protein [Paracoccaceae bacterium]
MQFDTLGAFAKQAAQLLVKGPVALILAEDAVELDTTIRHHIDAGFEHVVVFGAAQIEQPLGMSDKVVRVLHDMAAENALLGAVNTTIAAAPAVWFYYCYNAEYLFYPFCEHRSASEMIAFATEERRDSVLTYVIDLYAADLWAHPNAVSLEDAHMDKSGYYALARPDPANHNHPKERQLDFYGGLRWRFEEHIPTPRRRIDRIGIFKSKPGLKLLDDHTFNDAEYNTFACPWHNNLTAAICSFRTAKALKRNPGSTYDIETFQWHNSVPFDWHSQQLLDLGLIEPGQWF